NYSGIAACLRNRCLRTLREYWRWRKPRLYMFPTRILGRRLDQPILTNLSGLHVARLRVGPASANASRRILCATVGRLTCWMQVPTCAPFRFCSATAIWKPQRSTCIIGGDVTVGPEPNSCFGPLVKSPNSFIFPLKTSCKRLVGCECLAHFHELRGEPS